MNEGKKDCRFYVQSHKRVECNALRKLFCRVEDCSFYKPRRINAKTNELDDGR